MVICNFQPLVLGPDVRKKKKLQDDEQEKAAEISRGGSWGTKYMIHTKNILIPTYPSSSIIFYSFLVLSWRFLNRQLGTKPDFGIDSWEKLHITLLLRIWKLKVLHI